MKTAHLARFAFAVLLTAAPLLTACADENDATTWVKRLDDPARRAQAVTRLCKFFDDAMAKANKNREDPQVKELFDEIVPPFAQEYMNSSVVGDPVRKDLVRVLAQSHDARGFPSLIKALSLPDPKKSEEEMEFAAQGVRELGLSDKSGKIDQALVDALWTAFVKVPASQARGFAEEARAAVVAVKSPSYGPKCQEMLGAAVDPANTEASHDALQFWQPTCIEVIKELKFAPAVRPLIAILVTPAKKSLVAAAQSALLTMPKEAELPLAAALTGTDADFAPLETSWPDRGYIAVTAEALGWLGRPIGRGAALAVLSIADNDTNRVAIAQTLNRYPADPSVVSAFVAAYSKIAGTDPGPQDLSNPKSTDHAPVRATSPHVPLLAAAPFFFDTQLTDWLLKTLAAAKGPEKEGTLLVSLVSAIELMSPRQVPAVAAAVAKDGTFHENEMLKVATAITTKCGTDAACYVKVLDEPITPRSNTAALKAAIMAGVYGNEGTRKELVRRIEPIRDGAVRVALAEAILHLAPAGDLAAAAALEKVIARDHAASTTDGAIASKLALTLRARAVP